MAVTSVQGAPYSVNVAQRSPWGRGALASAEGATYFVAATCTAQSPEGRGTVFGAQCAISCRRYRHRCAKSLAKHRATISNSNAHCRPKTRAVILPQGISRTEKRDLSTRALVAREGTAPPIWPRLLVWRAADQRHKARQSASKLVSQRATQPFSLPSASQASQSASPTPATHTPQTQPLRAHR